MAEADSLRPRPKLQKANVGEEFRKAGERIYDPDVIIGGRSPEPPSSGRQEDIIIGRTE
jgi:hypothetical protein